MWNMVGAVGCAFFAGFYTGIGNTFGFWLNVFFVLVNIVFVWHDYSKHKE